MTMQILNTPLTRLTFGKYQGIRWKHVPMSYKMWALRSGVVYFRKNSFKYLRSKLIRVWY